MRDLLVQLVGNLGHQIRPDITVPQLRRLNDYISETYHGWKEIVKKGVKHGLKAGLIALKSVKKVVVKKCRQNKTLLKYLTKIAFKASARAVAEYGAKQAIMRVVEQGTKQVVAQSAKGFIKVANPIGTIADVTQEALTYCGHENAGQNIGKAGNILAGAITGAGIAGVPGAAVGALGGLIIWGVAQVTGEVVEKAF